MARKTFLRSPSARSIHKAGVSLKPRSTPRPFLSGDWPDPTRGSRTSITAGTNTPFVQACGRGWRGLSGIQLQRSRGILRSRTQERSVRTASCPGLRQPRPQHPAGCAPSWHSAPLGARRRDSSGCSSSGFRALRVQPGTRRAEEATAEGTWQAA